MNLGGGGCNGPRLSHHTPAGDDNSKTLSQNENQNQKTNKQIKTTKKPRTTVQVKLMMELGDQLKDDLMDPKLGTQKILGRVCNMKGTI